MYIQYSTSAVSNEHDDHMVSGESIPLWDPDDEPEAHQRFA
jgi:hypothetical protein